MDKKQLDSILKNAYNPTLWRQVLTDVFGARNLNQTPQPIILPSNDLSENAFELGFFNTTDERVIGLYQIELKSNVKIGRNKVGVRDLLRSIYKTDVDGALVVFVQNDKWRLSFISEIRVLNDDGTIDTKATEPKRYTYLLGTGEKTKTPTDRLSLLANKKIALEDIRAAFSVEALNNEFYKQISEYFYQIVGSTTKKGKKTEVREKIMSLPGVADDARKTYQEFAVRLIGRTVFCWFLKMKKSENDNPLLPEKLLSSEAVRTNRNYYHEILEPLFFQTLNTPMNNRIADLPAGCEIVPFLNGGLFEPQIEDFYNSNSKTGSYQMYDLKIPDEWFAEFFKKLEEYNFTIDENSPTEVEISVDPEMLGRIFENLLAEIDPDSGETARKATGSFYTPREIVNYMVDESLLIYLKSKLQTESVSYQSLKSPQATIGGNDWRVGQAELEYPLNENRWQGKEKELEAALRELFSYSNNENPFEKDAETTTKLIKAIDECKILDPACGSGAFPIGVLQRLVYLLGKLDKKSKKWKAAQLDKIDQLIETAKEIDDFKIRGKVTGDLQTRKDEIEKDFANKELDFGRKLFLIENCIYGVDIQPIAAEISKLRCFLTLIVDDTIDENKPNRGVNPLPNLEFKFVTADALLKLPESGLFQATTETQMSRLEQIRHEYINSYGERKESAKQHFKQIQDEIFKKQIENSHKETQDARAIALATWNPFGHEKVDWFDSLWMFGVKAFDIVIGNPPYVQMQKDGGHLAKMYAKENYETFERTGDIYSLFYERSFQVLDEKGILTFITSNKWMRAGYGKSLRKYFSEKTNPIQLVDFGQTMIFQSAIVHSNILISQKAKNQHKTETVQFEQDLYKDNLSVLNYFNQNKVIASHLGQDVWTIVKSSDLEIRRKVEKIGTQLKKWKIEFNRGILTGLNEAFILDGKTKENLIKKDSQNSKILKPILRGRDTRKYYCNFSDNWLINSHNGQRSKGLKRIEVQKEYPIIYEYLLQFKDKAQKRLDKGNHWTNLRNCAYLDEIRKPKIVFSEIVSEPQFHYDTKGYYPEATVFFITGENLKYLISLLNSKPVTYFFKKFYAGGELVGKYRYKKAFMENLPLPQISKEKQKPFENLVDYILFLKETDAAEQVNGSEFKRGTHFASDGEARREHAEAWTQNAVGQFEEVIDALVYELYFEEDFRRENIEFLKYAERDFLPIEGLSREKKIETIHAAYQKLRQKDNEIQTNLKLMDIRLEDLIMPIKTAR